MYGSKTKLSKFVLFALIFSITVSPMLIFQNSIDANAATTIAQDKSAVSDMNKQIALKKQQIAQTEKEIAALRNSQSSYTTLKTKLDEKIVLIEESIAMYDELRVLHSEEIGELEKKAEEAQTQYDIRYAAFLEMIRVTYEEGNASYVEMIVKSENLSDFLSRVDIISDLIEYNKNIIDDLKKSKEDTLIRIATYENAVGENLGYVEAQREKIDEAKAEKKEADKAIAEIQRDLQQKINLQSTITRDMGNTQSEIQRVLNEIAAKERASQAAPRQYVGGALHWPTDSGRGVSSPYGPRVHPITGQSEFHTGIDIPGGTNILAANDGTVIIATYNSGYGNYLVLDHGGGMTTLYAHSSSLYVKVGQTVKRGEAIARVGTTGVSTGIHLHFEVSVNGARQNPMNYFK